MNTILTRNCLRIISMIDRKEMHIRKFRYIKVYEQRHAFRIKSLTLSDIKDIFICRKIEHVLANCNSMEK